MKTFRWVPFITLCIAFFASYPAHAKECARCKLEAAWGLASQPADLFNPDTVARFDGQVLSVQEVSPETDVVDGVYVLLKTADGNMSVRLGPKSYLERHKFLIEPYDHLEVMASKVTTVNDRPALVATKAKVGDNSVNLRNSKGEGLWKK